MGDARIDRMKRIFFVLLLACLPVRSGFAQANFVRIDAPSLPNAYRVDDSVVCGGLPDGEAGFAALAGLGIKTIISVDGQVPDVDAATKHGLRYVHLPHGYDGVPADRVLELAKAINDLPGPVYVHCHHGKHRSPAAAAAACVVAGRMDVAAANELLTVAGTSRDYTGLYQSVALAKPVDQQTLAMLKVTFEPIATIPELAASMVQVDAIWDRLKRVGGNDPHQALLLREQFAEMLRMSDVADRGELFASHLQRSLDLARELETTVKRSAEADERAVVMERIEADCKACHRQHRD